MKYRGLQRAAAALCLLTLMSCTSPSCRQWELQEILTQSPCFNGGRLILPPDSSYSRIELEITNNRSGMRLYMNLLFLQAAPCKENPERTRMEITFEDQEEPWIIYPFRFEGGQRLLLCQEDSDFLIQALLNGRACTARMGWSSIQIIVGNFAVAYKNLVGIAV